MDIPNVPVKQAFLDSPSFGTNVVIPAVSGKQIKVLSVALVSKAANDVYFLSGANKISATMPLGANGGFVLPFNAYGWFVTNEGEGLAVNVSAITQTGVMVSYIED
jgi:hypothetical protein